MKNPFTPLEHAAWGGLVEVQGRIFRLIEEDLRRHSHISHAEFEVLLRLTFAPRQRARIQDLARSSLLTHSGTSRVVDRLARAGFVIRADADEDGRGAYAVLTEEGARHFQAAAGHHVELVRSAFLSRFTQKELQQMAALWRRMEDAPAKAEKKRR